MKSTLEQPDITPCREGLLLAVMLLASFGTVMVFSSTGFSRSLQLQPDYIVKHLCFLCLSGALMVLIWQLPQRQLARLAPWAFLLGLSLLIIVLVPGVGSRINGAQRWFRLGPISLQPSEFMKVLLPVFLAWWSGQTDNDSGFRKQVGCLSVLMVTPLLIALQPDLGTALLVLGMGACYLFLSGWPIRIFVLGTVSVLPVLGFLMLYRPYQLRRITAYLDALGHWDQAQYQVKQSLLSIGSGGIWGMGPGQGLQKLSFLPESHTDFIFAVIGEESGLCGTLSVISLWLVILLCGVQLVKKIEQDREAFALAGTLLFGIVMQALVNSCVVTSLLPPKGISHPLLSYGGSNLLATLIAFGLILNLTSKKQSSTPMFLKRSQTVEAS